MGVMWTFNATHYDEHRKAHLEVIRRVLGIQRRADHTTSRKPRPSSESIETTNRKRWLFFAEVTTLRTAKQGAITHSHRNARTYGNGDAFSLGQWHDKSRSDYPHTAVVV